VKSVQEEIQTTHAALFAVGIAMIEIIQNVIAQLVIVWVFQDPFSIPRATKRNGDHLTDGGRWTEVTTLLNE